MQITGFAGYFITKFFNSFKKISFLLDKIETAFLENELKGFGVDKPIYITGLARAGTTIILEMLEKHPDLATHRYKNVIMPFLPKWFSQISDRFRFYSQPFERLHRDGIMVNSESPEAVEEVFWQIFFKDLHNEEFSNIISEDKSNSKFEKFYINHIKKLLWYQGCSRYLTKNNYILTRFGYLLKIIPDAKILLIIRNPMEHIASLIKQTILFKKLEENNPHLPDWLKIVGHNEFGRNQKCINVKNTEEIRKIREMWKSKESFVKGWAYYWRSIYHFIANQLDINDLLKKAILIIKYEDLCENPSNTIDKILKHAELPLEPFKKVKEVYIKKLHKPSYYNPNFSEQEIQEIKTITKETAAKFGY
ncbi:MAG: sulfotransferase [Promethearchaeota archaeon]